jgi:hypothetical protein
LIRRALQFTDSYTRVIDDDHLTGLRQHRPHGFGINVLAAFE